MKKRTLILDVDGTLWDSTAVVARAWNAALQSYGIENFTITADMLKKVFGKTMLEIAEVFFSGWSDERKVEIMELCYEYEHKYVGENDTDIFYPGVKETIPALARKFDLFVVSNCQSGYIEVMLEKSGFAEYIRDTECYGDTLKSKGENIKLIMERNQVTDAFYVGDTLGDYQSAVFAGIPFIFAAYGFGEVPEPDMTITEFSQLTELCLEEPE